MRVTRGEADPTARVAPALALVVDLLVVAVFVLVGRRTHHDDAGLAGFARVAWPFAVGLVAGWAVSGLRRAPFERRRVAVTSAATVAVATFLRIVVQDRSAEPPFLLVALLFFGVCLFGWRALFGRWSEKRLARPRTRVVND
jgi:peptidoglycan/LPS O-acetylase OafA/YrhL